MDPNKNRPQGRRKNVTSGGNGAHRRGDGLGTGPVGSGSYSGGPTGGGGSNAKRAAAGGGGLITLLIICFFIFKLMSGGAGLSGGGNGGGGNNAGGGLGSLLGSLTGGSAPSGFDFSSEDTAVGSDTSDSTVDTSVATGSREKRTVIKGNGEDVVTLMIYMCGTDLESKYGMASSDMQEMANADFGDNVNVIIFTGGCSKWKINGVSNKINQIYQIKNKQLTRIVEDAGNKAMTDPGNLASFIQFCANNYPANRNELILWDHGGGSVTGYGYDEKNKNSGSMSLAGVNQALKAGGVKFDFIGFDACLMATAETALMLNEHADYMIASEETEPGIGWYYTNWLSKLGSNTSTPTLEIGKNIVDDFVTECGRKCKGQKTTLSVIDLAEFSNTVPKDLSAFSKSISDKIAKDEYKDISNARYSTREFAESTRIDQVDLVDLAEKIGTPEAKALASSLKNSVKYNRTSSNMTNAYGVSIYFPYQRASYVDKACNTYSQIGMDSEYSKCIKQFAKVETGGQIAAGGTGSVLGSLFGGAASSGSSGSADVIGSLLTSFLGGGRSIDGLDDSNSEFMKDTDVNDTAQYLSTHYFDPSKLTWQESNGTYYMSLDDSQWEMVHKLDLNMFYDDGSGYIDLGLDNIYSFDTNGNLIADTDKNWLSINGNVVAYYHTDTTKSGNDTIYTGYVPAFLNGERVNLIIQFTNDDNGVITGASTDYVGGETEAVAKNLTEIKAGDKLDFICDYYTYDMKYQDSYYIGEQVTVTDNMIISNTDVGSGACHILYRFSDIYNQDYWSEPIVIK